MPKSRSFPTSSLNKTNGAAEKNSSKRSWTLKILVNYSLFRWYSSLVTFSIHSTDLPFDASWMAMWVIAVVSVAPCQCFSPGENQITSPGRISSIGPSQRCAQPRPDVTINVWPNGCVCQAVRAPASNVTIAPRTRAGSGASNSGSMRTLPVNHSAGPVPDGCEPLRLISIYGTSFHFTEWANAFTPPLLLNQCTIRNVAGV